jgi:cysteine desulfurase
MSIYLNYNASTPIDPAVTEAMRPFLDEAFGNPSSGHWASAPAKAALERAREEVAKLLDAAPDEIVFTSGGSEANNLAIKARTSPRRAAERTSSPRPSSIPAVLAPCRFIERVGGSITYLPVDRTGLIDPEDVRRAITPRTLLISIMHANNEVGTVQPLAEIGVIGREHGIRFHTDAAQSVGKIRTRVGELGIDMLTIAGHKLYAPKGVGALYVRRGIELEPVIHGAGHESGRRAGTESALLAVGLGTACAMAADLAPMSRVQALRDRFWQALQMAGSVSQSEPAYSSLVNA